MKQQLIGSMAAFVTVLVVGTLIDSHRAHVAQRSQISLEKPATQSASKTSQKERQQDRRDGEALGDDSGELK